MEEKKNENEKVKKSISKRGLVIGLSALLLAGGGATGFLLANQKDAKAMELGMEQVAVETPSQSLSLASVTPVSTTPVATSKPSVSQEDKSKQLWLDKHKVIVNSDNPSNVTIKACDAAKIALEDIKKDTKQVDDDCDVELFHINTAGTGKSTGIWSGVAILNDTNRYEFRINDATGEVMERADYVTGDSQFKWKRTNPTGKSIDETIINDQKLAAFTKIDASKLYVTDCEIVEGKNYGIYIKYNTDKQTASYENKNGVLTVKVEKVKHTKNIRNSAHVTITVPKNTKFDSVVCNNDVGSLSVGSFEITSLKSYQDCGNLQLKGTSYQKADLSVECGNASFSGCKLKNTTLAADCGNASFSDCTMVSTKASADCGNIEIKNSNMTDTAMKADCGNIEGKNVVSKNLKLGAESGCINVVGDLTGTNDITATDGAITLGCTKDKSQYSYTLSGDSGAMFVDNKSISKKDAKYQNSSAANSIKALSDEGYCSIAFKVDPKAKMKTPAYDYDSWKDGNGCYYDDDDYDYDWDDDDWDNDDDDDDWDDDDWDNDDFFKNVF